MTFPITAVDCRRCFSSGGSRSMRAARTACTVGGTCTPGRPEAHTISAALFHQNFRLDQCPDALLEEEGVALRAGDQETLQRVHGGIVAEKGLQELFGPGWGQRVDPELRVVALVAPRVLVLGAVVHQKKHPSRRQALHQAV